MRCNKEKTQNPSKLIKKLTNLFNINLKLNLIYFGKSLILIAIIAAATIVLDSILNRLKQLIRKNNPCKDDELFNSIFNTNDSLQNDININEDNVKTYIKNNKYLQKIIKESNNNLNKQKANNIDLSCDNPNFYNIQKEKLINELNKQSSTSQINTNSNGNNYIDAALSISSFDEETNNLDISSLNSTLNNICGKIPYIILIYFIVLKIKELLNKTEYPSPNWGQYLQRLIIYIGAILKSQFKESKDQDLEISINFLKLLDAIILASLIASLIFLNNRKKQQKKCQDSLDEISKSLICNNQLTIPFDVIVNKDNNKVKKNLLDPKNINDLLNSDSSILCPVDKENEPIVPHQPFELKIDCEIIDNKIQQPQPIELDPTLVTTNDTAVKAIFENESSNNFNILVNKNQHINSNTVLGMLGGSRIYSPVEGIVHNIQGQKIFINDVKDVESTYIDSLINNLQELYKELNNTKLFLKDFYIDSLYPIMLNNSKPYASYSEKEYRKIFYKNGVNERFQLILTEYKTAKQNYENNISIITGADNVKSKSENDQLNVLKNDFDNEEAVYFNKLNELSKRAESESLVTLPNYYEFILIDYYFNIYESIISYYNQNDMIIKYRDIINNILSKRYFVDKWDQTKLKNKLNSICNDLSKGTYLETSIDYYNQMTRIYNETNNINDVQYYVNSLGNDNVNITQDQKQTLIDKIMFIFNFMLQIMQKINQKFETTDDFKKSSNNIVTTRSESILIKGFFDSLWKRYYEIPIQINNTINEINNIGNSPKIYSIIEIDDEQYRYYLIGKERTCPIPEEDKDDYINSFSKYGYGDIQYWLKYCSIATLVSVTNPASGWSTGLPPPLGPTPFPVVYMPIKSFSSEWGFIVIGLTITGIYVYPFVLVANLSMLHHVPFGDPATVIKTNINVLKKTISLSLKNFKQNILKTYLDNLKNEINFLNYQIQQLRDRMRNHRLLKPVNGSDNYENLLTKWLVDEAIMNEEMLTLKTKKFILETKYKIIYDVFMGSCTKQFKDPTIESIQQTEKTNDEAFSKLKKLIDSIELLIMPLPNAAKPVSANFLFTPKNPKPIIQIATDLDQNIHSGILDKILESFKLKNEDFSDPNFDNKSNNSIANWNLFKNTLKIAMYTLIINDPFPKYQNLKLTNIPWILFLYKDFTPTGAITYGIPGQIPLPSS